MPVAGCGGGGPAGPSRDPTSLPSAAGTWRGSEVMLPQQSAPSDHCIVDYFRGTPASFTTPVTLELTQDSTTVRGTYSGSELGAFQAFNCAVQGTYINGELRLEISGCNRQRFGLRPACVGALQRTGGRFTATPITTLSGEWRLTVSTWDVDGASTGTVEWVAQASFQP